PGMPPPPGGYDIEQEQYFSPQRNNRYGYDNRHMMMNQGGGRGNGEEGASSTGGGGSQKSVIRHYTEDEKEILRNVEWPKKIKNNGLPALWCHSCYLDKQMFKIVSPLSPKPSIVYFRHQQ